MLFSPVHSLGKIVKRCQSCSNCFARRKRLHCKSVKAESGFVLLYITPAFLGARFAQCAHESSLRQATFTFSPL